MGILVIENDNKSAELIYEIFYENIENLFFACDGEQALIAFRKYEISVVIIDLKISLINAIDLIQIMKTENPQIKIIALNSDTNNYDIDINQEKYCFDILIQKDYLYKYLYNAYLKLMNSEKTKFELSRVDLKEGLANLMIFKKAFEINFKNNL